MEKTSTIRLNIKTIKLLRSYKIYSRETDDTLILRMIEHFNSDGKLKKEGDE